MIEGGCWAGAFLALVVVIGLLMLPALGRQRRTDGLAPTGTVTHTRAPRKPTKPTPDPRYAGMSPATATAIRANARGAHLRPGDQVFRQDRPDLDGNNVFIVSRDGKTRQAYYDSGEG